MSEQEDSVLSRVSISTGVIPFPSMDSSLLLRQTLSALEESPSKPHEGPPSHKVTSDVSTLPFPTKPPTSSNGSPSPRPEHLRKNSTSYSVAEESHVTSSSSRLTSSDKLSALPSSTNLLNPTVTRTTRSPMFSALTNITRGFRRSLDASTSLPSFSMAEQDLNHSVWGTTPSFIAHTETGRNSGILERHPTPENASPGKETPKQRVSFDSDHGSLPTTRSVGQALLHLTRGSDLRATSPASVLRSSANMEHRDVDSSSNVQDRSQTPPHSHPTSPLRMLQRWSSGLLGFPVPVEEPFVPIDPFKLHYHVPFCCFPHTHDIESGDGSTLSGAYDCDDLVPTKSIKSFLDNTQFFVVDTLPRQVYLNFLFRLPAMYFSRVARIFEDAEVSKPDIQRMVDALGGGGTAMAGPGMTSMHGGNNGAITGTWEPNILAQSTPAHIPMTTFSPAAPGMRSPGATSGSPQGVTAPVASMIHMPLPFPDEWAPPLVSPALIRFKHSWEAFIDSLMREWKTLNVVSALLASTILTIFQVPQAGDDPVTRTAAFLSMICALMSLSYGCMYIVKFGMMRNMFHASRWAEEAQKTNTSILWNVWVLLAMPAVWMAWAMILFLASILSFVWRTGSVSDPSDPPPLDDRAVLGPRIAITCVFLLGLVYMAMIILTLMKYGSYELPTRTSANVGVGTRNTIQRGGIPTHRNTTEGQGIGATGENKIRARDIDAAMERRGRQRERSTSTAHIRRREEDMERRQYGGPSGVRDSSKKGGRNSKGMHGLGLVGGELEGLSEAEMDLKIDGLP